MQVRILNPKQTPAGLGPPSTQDIPGTFVKFPSWIIGIH